MELNTQLSQGQIIKYAIERKKTTDSKFSLRGLARGMGLSAAFLSKVCNDKALLPLNHLEMISGFLGLDSDQKGSLREAVLRVRVRQKSESVPAATAEVSQTEIAASTVAVSA